MSKTWVIRISGSRMYLMLKTILKPAQTLATGFAIMVFMGLSSGSAIAQNTLDQGEVAANEAVWVNVNMARILRIELHHLRQQ